MPWPYRKVLLEAVERSGRSARDISLSAVGHESAVRSLRRGLDMRVSTLEGLCRELELELYVGPPQLRDTPSAPDAAELRKLLDAIVKTYRNASTSTQRKSLLHFLGGMHNSLDHWVSMGTLMAEEFDEEPVSPDAMPKPPAWDEAD